MALNLKHLRDEMMHGMRDAAAQQRLVQDQYYDAYGGYDAYDAMKRQQIQDNLYREYKKGQQQDGRVDVYRVPPGAGVSIPIGPIPSLYMTNEQIKAASDPKPAKKAAPRGRFANLIMDDET